MAFGAGGANPFRGVNRPAPPVRTGPKSGPNRNRGPNPNKGNNPNPNKNPNKNPGKGKGKGGGEGGRADRIADASFAENPFSYTAPYTKGEKSQARGIANAQTKGPIAALASQRATNVAANQAGQKTDFGYYMSLAKAAQDAVATQGQIGAGLNTTLAGIGANTQQTLSSLGAAQQGGAVGRFNALGLGGDSAAQIAATQAQQQGLGALNSQAFQSAGALQGGNYQGFANQMPGVAALSGQEQIGNLARAGALANSTIDAQIAAKRAGAGSAYATALGQIRQNEVAGNLTQQTILGKQAELNQQQRQFNQQQATTRRGQTLSHLDHIATIAGENTRAAKANATRKTIDAADRSARQLIAGMKKNASGGGAGGSGAKPATTVQRQAAFAHIDYMTSEMQRVINAGYSPTYAYHIVQNGGYIQMGRVKDPLKSDPNHTRAVYQRFYPNRVGTPLLNIAYNVRNGGSGLSPGDLAFLRSIGIPNETRYPRSKGKSSGGGGTTRPASATDVANAGF